MKNKIKLCGIVFLIILMSFTVFGLDIKNDDTLVRYGTNLNVEWEHTKNSFAQQEYILSVSSSTDQTVSPSLILSEYTKSYDELTTDNIKIYFQEEQITYNYYTKWCTDFTYSDCQKDNNGSYTINGGQGQEEIINIIETLMPISDSQIKESELYFEFDLNDMVLSNGNTKKYRIEFNKEHDKNDYGVFSIMINENEFWDKTHSSDFLVNNQILYYKLEGNVLDETPNNNDGTTDGTTVTGIIDDGYSFDGVSEILDTPYTMPLGDKSVSFWIKSTNTGVFQTLVGAGGQLSGDDLGFHVYLHTGDYIYAYSGNVASSTQYALAVGSTDIVDGNWHHVVVSQTPTTFIIYIDGVVDGTSASFIGTETQGTATTFAYSNGVTPRYYNGDIDEIGIWNVGLDQNNVTFLYNGGAPTELQQYDYSEPIELYNTSLKLFHDTVTNVIVGSSTYSTIYSLTETFGTLTNMTITIPVTIEKQTGTQSNIIYYRTLLDGNPINDEMIVSIDTIGDIRSAFYNSFFEADATEHTIEIQTRRTGNGLLNISQSDINLYTGLTSNGTIRNGDVNKFDVDVSVTGNFVNISTGVLPLGSFNNTFVQFIGTVENTVSTNKNDISLKFFSDEEESGTLIRSVSDDVGSMFFNRMFYTNASTVYLQGNGTEDFTVKGYFYVFDFVDSDGGVIETLQIDNISANISDITLNSNVFGTTSSLSYYPTSSGQINYTHYLYNQNTSEFNYSETMRRTFTNGFAGVTGIFHEFTNFPINDTYDLGLNYSTTATGTPQYYNYMMVQGEDLNFSENTSGDVNITINEANNSYISQITGSCDSRFTVKQIIINNTDFIFSGDFDNFIFSYTGIDKLNLPVTITCIDQYSNIETVDRVYNIDTEKPQCAGIFNENLEIALNSTFVNYTFDVQCTDNIELSNFNVNCTNSFYDNKTLSSQILNYANNTIFSSVGDYTCNYNISDNAGNFQDYSNLIRVTKKSAFEPVLVFGVCPTGDDIRLLWIVAIIGFVLIIIGLLGGGLFNLIGLIGGIVLVMLGLYFLGCSAFVGVLTSLVGISIVIIFAVRDGTVDKDNFV